MTGQWTKASAGGCANHASYLSNPKFDLEIISNTPCVLLLKLEASKYAILADHSLSTGCLRKKYPCLFGSGKKDRQLESSK